MNDWEVVRAWIETNLSEEFLQKFEPNVTKRHWFYILSLAQTRGFSVELIRANKQREQVSVVVPFVDMLNHTQGEGVNVSSLLVVDGENYTFTIQALKDIKKGEQLFLNYNDTVKKMKECNHFCCCCC